MLKLKRNISLNGVAMQVVNLKNVVKLLWRLSRSLIHQYEILNNLLLTRKLKLHALQYYVIRCYLISENEFQ